jgi:2-phospho-L-lactate guanylyltransferase
MLDDLAASASSISSSESPERLRPCRPRPWAVVIPFKGTPNGKSRLRGLSDERRARLALAFLEDTVAAVRSVDLVAHVVIVSDSAQVRTLGRFSAGRRRTQLVTPIRIVSDPGGGLNAAVLKGIGHARRVMPTALVAAMTSDLPCLDGDDLRFALTSAAQLDRSFVPDSSGAGTTMITVGSGVSPSPHFGISSRLAHEQAGHQLIELSDHSGLRFDIDTVADLLSAGSDGRSVGPSTLAAIRILEQSPRPEPLASPHPHSHTTDQLDGVLTALQESQ